MTDAGPSNRSASTGDCFLSATRVTASRGVNDTLQTVALSPIAGTHYYSRAVVAP